MNKMGGLTEYMHFLWRKSGLVLLVFVSTMLIACGGGGGGGSTGASSSSSGDVSVTVSTFAGSSTVASTDATGAAASFNFVYGVAAVGGNLYVADTNNHTIRKIVIATGVVTTFAGTTGVSGHTNATGAAATFSCPAGLVNDGSYLYVTELCGNIIRKVDLASGAVSTLAGSGTASSVDATGAAATFNQPSGIASDGSNLYVTELGSHKIRKIVIASGAVSTVAGKGASGAVDATGTSASFNNPNDIATDGSNLYVADTSNNKIRQIVISSGVVTTLAGSGASGSLDNTGTAATFASPSGIVIDSGNLYVTEWNSYKIRKIVLASKAVTTLAGSGISGALDATGTAATFSALEGIASDGSKLYVADRGNHKVRQVVIASAAVSTLAGSENGFSIDATGTAATFFYPSGIVSDGSNLYVADTDNHKIRRVVIATGVVSTLAGAGAYGYANGTGTAAAFGYPAGLTLAGGNLYVTDTGNHNVRKIVISSGVVTTLAGASPGTSGAVDATGAAASFNTPSGITSDGSNLYVADEGNHKIRKIVIATGAVTTLAGTGVAGAVDATATAASFYYPYGITTDGTNLYVADTGNNKIRKIVIASGAVSSFAGSGTRGAVNATGIAASFYAPVGVATDGSNLFVADAGNLKVRKIVLSSGVVSTLAGSGATGVVDGSGATATFLSPYGIASVGGILYVTDSSGHVLRKIQ